MRPLYRLAAYSDFATVPLAIVAAGVAGADMHFYAYLCMTITGTIAWTLIEYGVHRALHLRRFPALRRFHMHHHQHPADATGGTQWSTLIIAALLYIALRWPLVAPAIAGFLVGYLWFLWLHHFMHHHLGFAPRDGLDEMTVVPARLRLAHELHHHAGPERMFGVSTTLWDRLFRTS